jgi:predicted phosphodiesterase
MRIALLSDIHGNIDALQAVLADAARSGVQRIVNLGDSLSGPLFPRETAAFLMQQDWPQLAGNHERQILNFKPGGSPSDAYALSMLEPAMLAWLRSLPGTLWLDEEVFLCHGTPSTDLQYFFESVTPAGDVVLATREEIAQRLGSTHARVVACGHTHVPRVLRHVSDDGHDCLLLNPGSVGLQAYDDDHPVPHLVQNGSPDARYAILEKHDGVWQAELLSVPYDYYRAAAAAHERGRPDWAHALLTGYALPMGMP